MNDYEANCCREALEHLGVAIQNMAEAFGHEAVPVDIVRLLDRAKRHAHQAEQRLSDAIAAAGP